MYEEMGDFSNKMETVRKSQMKMLDIFEMRIPSMSSSADRTYLKKEPANVK